MVNKLKLWIAKRQLAVAARHEEMMRESAKHVRKVVMPTIERRIERLESCIEHSHAASIKNRIA